MQQNKKSVPLWASFSLFAVLLGSVFFLKESFLAYQNVSANVEKLLGEQAVSIAEMAAAVVNPESHQKIVQSYLTKSPDIKKLDEFVKIQRILRRIQKIYKLEDNISTLVWLKTSPPNTLARVMSGNRKVRIGKSFIVRPQAFEVFSTKKAVNTLLFENDRGTWISAFAPVKDKKDNVIAVTAVQLRADGHLAAANKKVLGRVGTSSGILLIVFMIVAVWFGKKYRQKVKIVKIPSSDPEAGKTSKALEAKINQIEKTHATKIGEIEKTHATELSTLKTQTNVKTEELNKKLESSYNELSKLKETLNTNQVKLQSQQADLNQRDVEIEKIQHLHQNIIDCFPEACLVFNADGSLLSVISEKSKEIFGKGCTDKNLFELLEMPKDVLHDALKAFFTGSTNDTDGFPKTMSVDGQTVGLSYHPFFQGDGKLLGLVLIGSLDNTTLSKQEKPFGWQMGLRFKNQFVRFLRQARAASNSISSLSSNRDHSLTLLEELDAEARFFNCQVVENVTAPLLKKFTDDGLSENDVEKLKDAVSTAIDQFCHLFGYSQLPEDTTVEFEQHRLSEFAKLISPGVKTEKIKQHFVHQFVRQPIVSHLNDLDERVAFLTQGTNKKIDPIHIMGGDLRVVGNTYAGLLQSLNQAVRFAVVSSIESTEDRLKAGKSPTAKLALRFELLQESKEEPAWLFITLEDDGQGIAMADLRKRLGTDNSKLTNFEILQSLLSDQMSQNNLHLVQQAARSLGGQVELQTTEGKGMQITIMVPYQEPLLAIVGSQKSLDQAA